MNARWSLCFLHQRCWPVVRMQRLLCSTNVGEFIVMPFSPLFETLFLLFQVKQWHQEHWSIHFSVFSKAIRPTQSKERESHFGSSAGLPMDDWSSCWIYLMFIQSLEANEEEPTYLVSAVGWGKYELIFVLFMACFGQMQPYFFLISTSDALALVESALHVLRPWSSIKCRLPLVNIWYNIIHIKNNNPDDLISFPSFQATDHTMMITPKKYIDTHFLWQTTVLFKIAPLPDSISNHLGNNVGSCPSKRNAKLVGFWSPS